MVTAPLLGKVVGVYDGDTLTLLVDDNQQGKKRGTAGMRASPLTVHSPEPDGHTTPSGLFNLFCPDSGPG